MSPIQNTIKLQKFLAEAGVASRRASEELIVAKKVMVNGKVATLGMRVDPKTDRITMGGKHIKPTSELVYYLVNKPVGLVSTTSDEHDNPTVLTLLPEAVNQTYRLFPVGRLDKDSEGLMLLTNDGALTQQLTHPKYEVKKTYLALVDREPTEKALDHLMRGVSLQEGRTQPATAIVLYEWDASLGIGERDFHNSITKNSDDQENAEDFPIWLQITIHEGRYHQVRRMLERVGYNTLRLVRIAMGPLRLTDLRGRRVMKIQKPQI